VRVGRDERTQVRWSELEFEGELDGAGAADLVKGVEAAICAAGAQAARQRLRRATERGLFRVLLGLPKFGWLKMLKNSARKRRPTPFSPGIES
jgi:hypothetical protein